MKSSYVLILLSLVFTISVLAIVPSASSGVTIVEPTPGQAFSAGQPLVLVVKAPGYVGQQVTVNVYNPGNSLVYTNVFQIPSNGVLNVTLFTWPTTTSKEFVPGNYTIIVLVGSSAGAAVTVYWAPGIAHIVATVINGQTGMPMPGVPVNVYNVSNGMLLGSGITNSQGVANITIVAIPHQVETVKVIAMPSGYPPQGVELTITGPGVYSVTIKVYPTALQIFVVSVYQQGIEIAQSPLAISVYEGEPFYVIVDAVYEGTPVTTANVTATLTIGNMNMTATGTSIGNGEYNITFTVPSYNVTLNGVLKIVATYKGVESNVITLPVLAEPNTQAEIATLQKDFQTLYITVEKLNKTLTTLSTELSTLSSQLNSTNAKLNSLSSQLSSLQSQMSSLSSEISTLQSQLSGSTNMIYAALGISIVALILAIVALVYVLRKIS